MNTKSKVGYGAYLSVSESGLSLEILKECVKVKRFEHTSSTKLELQTLLWALRDIQTVRCRVTVYTDSQNIMGLQARHDRFEQNEYQSRKIRHLNNYKLYQEFYNMTDQMNLQFIKVRGHKISNQKDYIDMLFTLVDRASRNALRRDSNDQPAAGRLFSRHIS
ncbi:MAG: hypothetical protein JSW20_04705 [Nitrospiraceae bacterium]|nr:MAG: hypothetical protein JSW20_04705 [Nitrospiraceae bacterium]